MGWLGDLLQKIRGKQPTDFTLIEAIPAPGIPGVGQAMEPDGCYVELYVESLRLTQARRFATRFHGVVYTFVSLAREGESSSVLAAVTKPDKLAELDAGSLDRVITVSKQMMGAVPWRGGTLGLQLGLFSVKAGDLLTPIVDYVTRVSSAAGASFVGAIKPFVPLLTEGMDLLTGQRQDTAIEVAIDTDMSLSTSVVSAIVAVPKGKIDPSKVTLDPVDRKLLLDGKPLEAGYCVFSVRHTMQKADFGEIPALKEAYAAVVAAIRANKPNDAKDALTAFRLATIASADLITRDAARLVEKAEEKVREAFPGGAVSRDTKAVSGADSLAAIGLYN
jgi:hypothetical protein